MARHQMNTLIVDDSADNRHLLEAFLNGGGYPEVLSAESAVDAFSLLQMESATDDAPPVDLVLMDISMPGIDGIEACRRIKSVRKLADIPIIMVTASTDTRDLQSAFAAGAMDHITKPLNKTELLARVRSALTLKHEMDSRKLANTELERKNEELEQASRAKTLILSTATHELKTPLTSILGYVERLLHKQDRVGQLNERQQRYVETVERNAHRLQLLVDDLLDVSRIESGGFELDIMELNIRREIEEVAASMPGQLSERHVDLVVDIPTDLPEVRGDRFRVSQVLTNLVSNAVKYSPVDSTVTIRASAMAGEMQLDVVDKGIGISPADQSQLFSKFFRVDNSFTREVSGTGLGLFITKAIVEAHGGRVWVESEDGVGSTFSFTIPLSPIGAAQRGERNPRTAVSA